MVLSGAVSILRRCTSECTVKVISEMLIWGGEEETSTGGRRENEGGGRSRSYKILCQYITRRTGFTTGVEVGVGEDKSTIQRKSYVHCLLWWGEECLITL